MIETLDDLEIGEGAVIFRNEMYVASDGPVYVSPHTFLRDGNRYEKSYWEEDLIVYVEKVDKKKINVYVYHNPSSIRRLLLTQYSSSGDYTCELIKV